MLTVASLLAALTIAGAFWIGVLAARRLRDWGEGTRALEDSEARPLALGAASNNAPPDDPASKRVRAVLAERIHAQQQRVQAVVPRRLDAADAPELGLATLRVGDVVLVEGDRADDGDYVVEGIVHFREGSAATIVVIMGDTLRKRWLVGNPEVDRWHVVTPISDHGLLGEPPRHIVRGTTRYTLDRRGQASAAFIGQSPRPDGQRAATYLFRAGADDVLWVERWGDQIVMAEGHTLASHHVSFLPGS